MSSNKWLPIFQIHGSIVELKEHSDADAPIEFRQNYEVRKRKRSFLW